MPQIVLVPSTEDLSANTQRWHIRQGASWFALQECSLTSNWARDKIQLGICRVARGYGLVKLSNKLELENKVSFISPYCWDYLSV